MSGRSAVVTGAGRGIGRAILGRLVDDGWKVVAVDNDPDLVAELERDLGRAYVVHGDVSDRDLHVRAARAASAVAPLGGWVNNAGISPRAPLAGHDPQLLDRVLDVNVRGVVWGCEAAVAAFKAGGRAGSIVNISSIHGRRGFPDHPAYDLSKAAIDALTRNVAVSYGPDGIRANAVAPGAIDTPHLRSTIESAADPARAEADLVAVPPLRRLGRGEEIAAVVSFLLGEESSYLTGQSIAVDGGWSAGGIPSGRP